MVNYYTFSEYARLKGVSDRTVRNWKEQGKISVTSKVINNRSTYVVIVDENDPGGLNTSKRSEDFESLTEKGVQNLSEDFQDAEILENDPQQGLVSIENVTIERILQSIKELSEAKAESDQKTIDRIQAEYFEAKAEIKTLREELIKQKEQVQQEKILTIQTEAELKILQLQMTEKEKTDHANSFVIKEKEEALKAFEDLLKEKDEEIKKYQQELQKQTEIVNEFKSMVEELKKELKELKFEDKEKQQSSTNWLMKF